MVREAKIDLRLSYNIGYLKIKMPQYTVVTANNADELSTNVNWRLKDGWMVTGGVAVVQTSYGIQFSQALYKN